MGDPVFNIHSHFNNFELCWIFINISTNISSESIYKYDYNKYFSFEKHNLNKCNYPHLNFEAPWGSEYNIVGYFGPRWRRYAQCQCIAAWLGAALAHQKRTWALALQDLHGNVPGNARLVPARVLQLEILLLGSHVTKGVGQTAAPLATGTLIHSQAIGKDFGTGIGWKNI